MTHRSEAGTPGSASVVRPRVGMLLGWRFEVTQEPPFLCWRLLPSVELVGGLQEQQVWALAAGAEAWLSFPDALVPSL